MLPVNGALEVLTHIHMFYLSTTMRAYGVVPFSGDTRSKYAASDAFHSLRTNPIRTQAMLTVVQRKSHAAWRRRPQEVSPLLLSFSAVLWYNPTLPSLYTNLYKPSTMSSEFRCHSYKQ